MRKSGLIGLLLVILFVVSCSDSITNKDAELKAVNFVKTNVKFFSRADNTTETIPQYKISELASYKEGTNYIVVMHVSATSGNETKENDITVKVSEKDQVLEFNGQKVPG